MKSPMRMPPQGPLASLRALAKRVPRGLPAVGQTPYDVVWSENRTVDLGSVQQEHVASDLLSGLMTNMRAAIERFIEYVEQNPSNQ